MEFRFLAGPEILEAEKRMPVDQQAQWPADTIVCYVFDGEQVVGRQAVMSIKVLEGTWLADDKRKGTLGIRLMQMVEQFLVQIGNTHSLALAWDEQPSVAEYLQRLGFEKFPVQFYSKQLVSEEKAA